ncbi:MAG: 50S ribosomal protein L31 [Parcubacteria group bacterium ADurb.Bin305]|nr:MAG: 50S ribosomal protein L31 [Parcubacteria group bacterium ADurb.Bin305]
MKQNIHPKYYDKAEVRCICGAKFIVGSTSPEMEVEICSQCHPFFTGQEKLVDTAGRVQKFQQKLAKSAQLKTKKQIQKPGVDSQKTKVLKKTKQSSKPAQKHSDKK